MSINKEENKAVVIRFNKEFIEQGNMESFQELMDSEFINHTAPADADRGPAGILHTFNQILRPAIPDIKVTIYDQIAEGDLVTTRKNISGTHRGNLMGIPPTGEQISINVIDIVKIKNGRYAEHWGINTLPSVLAQLRAL